MRKTSNTAPRFKIEGMHCDACFDVDLLSVATRRSICDVKREYIINNFVAVVGGETFSFSASRASSAELRC